MTATSDFIVMYAWQHDKATLSLLDYYSVLQKRRCELLDSLDVCVPDEYGEETIAEWIALVKERDAILQELTSELNRQYLEHQLMMLYQCLQGVFSVANCKTLPSFLSTSLQSAHKQLQQYLKSTGVCTETLKPVASPVINDPLLVLESFSTPNLSLQNSGDTILIQQQHAIIKDQRLPLSLCLKSDKISQVETSYPSPLTTERKVDAMLNNGYLMHNGICLTENDATDHSSQEFSSVITGTGTDEDDSRSVQSFCTASTMDSCRSGREVNRVYKQRLFPTTLNYRLMKPMPVVDSADEIRKRCRQDYDDLAACVD